MFSTRHEHAENMETKKEKKEKRSNKYIKKRNRQDNDEKVALTEKKIRLTLTNLLQVNSSILISLVVESAL